MAMQNDSNDVLYVVFGLVIIMWEPPQLQSKAFKRIVAQLSPTAHTDVWRFVRTYQSLTIDDLVFVSLYCVLGSFGNQLSDSVVHVWGPVSVSLTVSHGHGPAPGLDLVLVLDLGLGRLG